VTDAHDVVRRGYDVIADRYAEWSASFETPVEAWLARFLARVPEGARVLELGCGGDNASTRMLAARYDYLGVDISEEQLARARRANPGARFLRADATALELDETFGGIVALFMLGHVRRSAQEPLLRKLASWLKPGGWLLCTMGTADADDVVESDWLGAPMFFASFDEQTNRELLLRSGFELVDARVVPFEEPGHGHVRFMWVLATRGASTPG
jgi:SAM-dependent methyltransferase